MRRPPLPVKEIGMSLPEVLAHYEIPYTDTDLRTRPMSLFVQLGYEVHKYLACNPDRISTTRQEQTRQNIVHEWSGYNKAMNNILVWALTTRETCEDAGALGLLAELIALVRAEIEAEPDLA